MIFLSELMFTSNAQLEMCTTKQQAKQFLKRFHTFGFSASKIRDY